MSWHATQGRHTLDLFTRQKPCFLEKRKCQTLHSNVLRVILESKHIKTMNLFYNTSPLSEAGRLGVNIPVGTLTVCTLL